MTTDHTFRRYPPLIVVAWIVLVGFVLVGFVVAYPDHRDAERDAERNAQQLTTAELADRLLAIAEAPRRYPPADVKAAQYEAAIRLRRPS